LLPLPDENAAAVALMQQWYGKMRRESRIERIMLYSIDYICCWCGSRQQQRLQGAFAAPSSSSPSLTKHLDFGTQGSRLPARLAKHGTRKLWCFLVSFLSCSLADRVSMTKKASLPIAHLRPSKSPPLRLIAATTAENNTKECSGNLLCRFQLFSTRSQLAKAHTTTNTTLHHSPFQRECRVTTQGGAYTFLYCSPISLLANDSLATTAALTSPPTLTTPNKPTRRRRPPTIPLRGIGNNTRECSSTFLCYFPVFSLLNTLPTPTMRCKLPSSTSSTALNVPRCHHPR
jgi:hypothetical protein